MYETFLFMRVPDDVSEAQSAFDDIELTLPYDLLSETNVEYPINARKHDVDEFVFSGSGDNCTVWTCGSVYRVKSRMNTDETRREIGRSLSRFPAWCVFQPGEGSAESAGHGPLSKSMPTNTARDYALIFIRDDHGGDHVRTLADTIAANAGPGTSCPVLFFDGAIIVVPTSAPAKIVAARHAASLRNTDSWAVYDSSGFFAAKAGLSPFWRPAAFAPWESDARAAAAERFD